MNVNQAAENKTRNKYKKEIITKTQSTRYNFSLKYKL